MPAAIGKYQYLDCEKHPPMVSYLVAPFTPAFEAFIQHEARQDVLHLHL